MSPTMTIDTKICGINSPAALDAAARGGAFMVGFNFFPPSPRAVTPQEAAALAERAPNGPRWVGVFVDPDDETLDRTLGAVRLDLLQLHGNETPARIAEVRARFGLPVMKAIKVATAADLAVVEDFAETVERFLFDAKAPKSMTDALPGGNALSFDWQLLAGKDWGRPWILSGGLRLDNLANAVKISGASAVDLASGVEDRPGVKNPDLIRAFLEKAQSL